MERYFLSASRKLWQIIWWLNSNTRGQHPGLGTWSGGGKSPLRHSSMWGKTPECREQASPSLGQRLLMPLKHCPAENDRSRWNFSQNSDCSGLWWVVIIDISSPWQGSLVVHLWRDRLWSQYQRLGIKECFPNVTLFNHYGKIHYKVLKVNS